MTKPPSNMAVLPGAAAGASPSHLVRFEIGLNEAVLEGHAPP